MIRDIKYFTYATLENALFFHEKTLFVIDAKSGFYTGYIWTDMPYLQGKLHTAVISMFKYLYLEPS